MIDPLVPKTAAPEIRPAAIVISAQEGLAIVTGLFAMTLSEVEEPTPGTSDEIRQEAHDENIAIICKVLRKWPGLMTYLQACVSDPTTAVIYRQIHERFYQQ